MSFNKSMLKATVFMDHSNIYSPLQKKEEFKDFVINYHKLRKILLQDFISAGAFAFLGVSHPIKPEKRRFMNYLELSGFTPLSRNERYSLRTKTII